MRIMTGIMLAGLAALPAYAELPAVTPPKALPDKPKPEVCAQVFQPVCGKKQGHPKDYTSECMARMDGASGIKPGHCSPGE